MLSAERESPGCWPRPASVPAAALPPTPSPHRVLVFADVREVAFPSESGPGPSSLYVASRPRHVSRRCEWLTARRFSRVPGAGQSGSLQRGLVRVEPRHSAGHLSPAWAFALTGGLCPASTALGGHSSPGPRGALHAPGTSHQLLFSRLC